MGCMQCQTANIYSEFLIDSEEQKNRTLNTVLITSICLEDLDINVYLKSKISRNYKWRSDYITYSS